MSLITSVNISSDEFAAKKQDQKTKGLMLASAIMIAAKAHEGQLDKSGKPYILHPMRVMQYLETDDVELQCMAMLHDVIEDTSVTYAELREAGMSERVIDGVRAVTKVKGQTYEEYKEAVFASVDGMLVKRADLTDNSDIRRLKGISPKDVERTVKYHQFYIEIAVELQKKGLV